LDFAEPGHVVEVLFVGESVEFAVPVGQEPGFEVAVSQFALFVGAVADGPEPGVVGL